MWSEVLRIAPIGVHDEFVALGGKSLHLVRIHGELVRRCGAHLELVDMFRLGTVAAMARALAAQSGAADVSADARAKTRIDRMRTSRQALAARRREAGDRR